MSKLNLMAHCGANYVSRSEIGKADLPAATSSYTPIAHDYFADLVEDQLNEAGLKVIDTAFALGKDGANMFGMMQVGSDTDADFSTVVGLRNSHIKWFAASLACGSGVFVCDNLAFSGEVTVGRMHTAHILNDLPQVVTDAIHGTEGVRGILEIKQVQEQRYEAYKGRELREFEAEYVMVEMLRRDILNPRRFPKVVQQWDTPDHEEFTRTGPSGWRMFNAVTEALKETNILEYPRRTHKLHELMDEVVEFEAAA